MFFSYLEVLILQILTFIFKILSQIEISFLFTMLHIVLNIHQAHCMSFFILLVFLNVVLCHIIFQNIEDLLVHWPFVLFKMKDKLPYSMTRVLLKTESPQSLSLKQKVNH